MRDYVVERIGDRAGVLVADETGFVKKGRASAGVQRQYSGTAGKTEKCQIGTFLCYATARGRALIDREFYLPKSWTGDRDRCRRAAVPDAVEFATKPQQAQAMLERTVAAGVPFSWFTADEAYGQNPGLRGWLEDQDTRRLPARPDRGSRGTSKAVRSRKGSTSGAICPLNSSGTTKSAGEETACKSAESCA
ncbi:hypothetical protein C1I93_23960 [Micromonospora endophytica]|uniref:Transposase IS701-like DDE domain-containing protein n=1 Tax=Micromonospora endophytica TaxID=515350 RepID=A0A2W2CN22_9ACTN|nr:hypothetical protein C1I93_23960 [Micromonospora endophytica]RIW40261.1 transposase [Micromonospora endophytica]BCJ58160.1 hypothetical protein Jiend_15820 [Micromonospora endophytica]